MKKRIIFLFLILSFTKSFGTVAQPILQLDLPPFLKNLGFDGKVTPEHLKMLSEIPMAFGQAAEKWFEDDREKLEERLQIIAASIARLETLRKDPQTQTKLAKLKTEQKQLEEKLQKIQKSEDKWDNFAETNFNAASSALWNNVAKKQKLEEITIQAAVTQDKKNEGALQRLQYLTSKENLTRVGEGLCLVSLGLTAGYYSSKLAYRYFNSLIGMPTLVRESSKHDWKDSLKTVWYQKLLQHSLPATKLEDVILNPEMTQKLKLLALDTRNTQQNILPYRHVLFYGLPGTGKTMFAKKLAQYSGMDYAILSGADFSQFKDGQSITKMHELFDWAENSKKGLLIFVDEADAFLRDRKVLDNQSRNLVNAFLSRTGENSEKYMLVFATNYKDELDSAVLSRINKKVNFPLPAFEQRKQILDLYINKYIINEKRLIVRDNKKIEFKIELAKDVNEQFINSIVKEIDGFSGREIEQMVSEFRIAGYNYGKGTLTQEIMQNIVDEKIAEHKHDVECIEYQRQRSLKALEKEGVN